MAASDPAERGSPPPGKPAPITDDGPLSGVLRSIIRDEGPLSVERFMSLALGHPSHGYYVTRDPFGAAGDFTTAPEISQMFGELLGLWAAEVWTRLGQPDPVRFVELGPGRGTLMADALRAARLVPAFRQAIDIHLVETSPVLREMQAATFSKAGHSAAWHAAVDTLPPGPALILANEFLDALPIRQYVASKPGWCERLVGLDANGLLAFGLAAEPEPSLARLPMPRPGKAGPAVLELSPASQQVMRELALRIVRHGGALLAIDYGSAKAGFTDTLQAVRGHRFVDPLHQPGEADLTAHVNFGMLARTAAEVGATVHGPVTQGSFLRALGIEERAAALKRSAGRVQAEAVEAALERLTGPDPGMGDLFKVLAVTHPATPAPPGFASEPMP